MFVPRNVANNMYHFKLLQFKYRLWCNYCLKTSCLVKSTNKHRKSLMAVNYCKTYILITHNMKIISIHIFLLGNQNEVCQKVIFKKSTNQFNKLDMMCVDFNGHDKLHNTFNNFMFYVFSCFVLKKCQTHNKVSV